jgi:hypothetical protein
VDTFGPLAPTVVSIGQIVAAGVAAFAAISGRSFWSPVIPGLKNYAVRIFGTIAGLGVALLYVSSNHRPTTINYSLFSIVSISIGFMGALAYLFLRIWLCFQCDEDKAWYARGLKLRSEAEQVLSGDLTGLPAPYAGIIPPLPTTETQFFCRSGKHPDFIWTRGSYASSLLLLVTAYGFTMVPLTLALASGSLLLGGG